jgi:hypothetical protein
MKCFIYLELEYNKFEAGQFSLHIDEILTLNFTDVLAYFSVHLCALSRRTHVVVECHGVVHHLRFEHKHRHEPLAFELSSVGLEAGIDH